MSGVLIMFPMIRYQTSTSAVMSGIERWVFGGKGQRVSFSFVLTSRLVGSGLVHHSYGSEVFGGEAQARPPAGRGPLRRSARM